MPKYKLVLFDMDGTIANTDEMVVLSFLELFDKYGKGRRPTREELYYFSGPPLFESLKKLFPDGDMDLLFKEFYKISKPKYDEVVVTYPNARKVIENFKKHGIKLGVVTNKKHDMSMYCLDIIGLYDLFDIVIGYEDVTKMKPDPEGILTAMARLGIQDNKDVLYVGDNPIDCYAGANANVDVAFACYGPRVFHDKISPTYRINSFKELEEVVLNEN